MSKKFRIIFLVIVSVFTITSVAVCQVDKDTLNDLYSEVELFSYALTTIQSEYVDKKTPQELIYGSLKGMLSSLDPHSQFMDPEEYNELKTETQGKFGGLGIEISIRDGLLTVITPLEDTPAWNAGLEAGDRIVKIDDKLTKDLTLNDAVKLLRGDPGTEVKVTVLRENDFKIKEYTIKREIIQVQDVKNVQILEDHIGYIRLTEFREDSAKEFAKGLDELKKDGADSLIVDLRNNPGGLLNVAIDITDMFLPVGETIVSTKGRRPSQSTITKSKRDPGVVGEWPVTVLINHGSASGSEILTGALKDNHRAVVIGTTSFGKGSVQSVIPLPDGSGLRLTTAKYFTPSGISIQGTGIKPDIFIKRVIPPEPKTEDSSDKHIEDVFEVFETEADQAKTAPKMKGLTEQEKKARQRILQDNQVQSAIDVLKGIKTFKGFTQKTATGNEKT